MPTLHTDDQDVTMKEVINETAEIFEAATLRKPQTSSSDETLSILFPVAVFTTRKGNQYIFSRNLLLLTEEVSLKTFGDGKTVILPGKLVFQFDAFFATQKANISQENVLEARKRLEAACARWLTSLPLTTSH